MVSYYLRICYFVNDPCSLLLKDGFPGKDQIGEPRCTMLSVWSLNWRGSCPEGAYGPSKTQILFHVIVYLIYLTISLLYPNLIVRTGCLLSPRRRNARRSHTDFTCFARQAGPSHCWRKSYIFTVEWISKELKIINLLIACCLFVQAVAPIFSLVAPRFQFRGANKRGIPVSRDPAALLAKYSDPLVYTGPIRVRTGHEILRISSYLMRNFRSVTVPFFVLHGTADRVTDPLASQDLYNEAPSEFKNIKLYEGFLHDLLFEPEREEITQDIIDWMESRLTPACPEEATGLW